MNYFLNSQKLVSLGTNLNIFHFNVIGLSAPIARLAGRLQDGDCLPRGFTAGVVGLVAAATNYKQPGEGKK